MTERTKKSGHVGSAHTWNKSKPGESGAVIPRCRQLAELSEDVHNSPGRPFAQDPPSGGLFPALISPQLWTVEVFVAHERVLAAECLTAGGAGSAHDLEMARRDMFPHATRKDEV